ncbi:histidine kinase [Vibrio sp. qd031]|uniref:sensor histidine kinase n=1 Tax=Vibrio sp. qd031 TaxID=1603038 RepID=UPI000A10CFC6|nr:sensor histidine kinase [Vibrio sp. qd031]ORT48372.1 histidine kinase [Vibrio sp. qd031]
MELIFSLLQQMCVYLMVAYTLSKTPIIIPLLNNSTHIKHKATCYLLFSAFCILGTYFGLQIDDAIANTRAIGAVLGGIFGGPIVGFLVGLTGGIHRYFLGGFTDVACAVSTTAEGLIGGFVHLYYVRRERAEALFNPMVVFVITLVAEVVQMLIILAIARPFDQALSLVQAIAAPMIIANSVGAAVFVSILQDRKIIVEKFSATFSRKSLNIAEKTVGILSQGLTSESADKIARIVYQETRVGSVAITDTKQILAFVGIGEDHHKPSTLISSQYTRDAINNNSIIYLDGSEKPYQCSISDTCKLGSALVIPLRRGEEVIGTIKLYEPRRKLFSSIHMSMAEGIAELLSTQLLYMDYQQKQMLLSQSEIKLLQAQVNPHFLFNALNTISAVIRKDPDKARDLIQHLSTFFRGNLKRNVETVTLGQEIEHVNAYLTIEQARFMDRLTVDIDLPDALLETVIPSFSIQPLVENSIKHGISKMLEGGTVRIYAQPINGRHFLMVEDNAGLFPIDLDPQTSVQSQGLGLNIVDKRLQNLLGPQSALKIDCEVGSVTRARFMLPVQS